MHYLKYYIYLVYQWVTSYGKNTDDVHFRIAMYVSIASSIYMLSLLIFLNRKANHLFDLVDEKIEKTVLVIIPLMILFSVRIFIKGDRLNEIVKDFEHLNDVRKDHILYSILGLGYVLLFLAVVI